MANRGRPSKYTKQLADKICLLLMQPRSLRWICEQNDDMPSKTTVLNWLNNDKYSDFLDQYTHAREIQSDMIVDDIADTATLAREILTAAPVPLLDDDGNVMTTKAGVPVFIQPFDKNTASMINAVVGSLEKAAKLMAPKKYNSAHINHGDSEGNPLEAAGKIAIEEMNVQIDRLGGDDG